MRPIQGRSTSESSCSALASQARARRRINSTSHLRCVWRWCATRESLAMREVVVWSVPIVRAWVGGYRWCSIVLCFFVGVMCVYSHICMVWVCIRVCVLVCSCMLRCFVCVCECRIVRCPVSTDGVSSVATSSCCVPFPFLLFPSFPSLYLPLLPFARGYSYPYPFPLTDIALIRSTTATIQERSQRVK